LERVGLIRGDRSQKFWADFFYRVVPRLPRGKCTVSGFRVDVYGEQDGGQAHRWYTCVGRMKSITSIPAALGAVMLAQGEIAEQGVFAPEAVIDPEPFLAKLEPLGVKVEEHEG
jgi:saccharopine dehydrogenase-like NADP-dependent oxidoreductase